MNKIIGLVTWVFLMSVSAMGVELEDLNQDWVLDTKGVQQGVCADSLSIAQTGPLSLQVNDKTYRLPEGVEGKFKYVVAVEGDQLTIQTHKKKFFGDGFSKKPRETQSFEVVRDRSGWLDRLTAQVETRQSGVVQACDYKLQNPELQIPPAGCHAYLNGQAYFRAQCQFSALADGREHCTLAHVVIEARDEEKRVSSIYWYSRLSVLREKREILNQGVVYTLDGDLVTTNIPDNDGAMPEILPEKISGQIYPSRERAFLVNRKAGTELEIRCE